MTNEDEILKKAWARTGACPEVSLLLDGIERGDAAMQAHMAECARCSAEASLFRNITSSPVPSGGTVRSLDERVRSAIRGGDDTARRRGNWWSRLFRPVVLTPVVTAAALLLVVVAIRVQQQATPAVYERVERSQTVELLSPKGQLSEAPSTLRWSAVEGAVSYRVRILEVDRNIVWEATSNTTHAAVPSNVQKQALPGKRLLWTVEAFNSKGEVVASGTQDFTVAIARKDAH